MDSCTRIYDKEPKKWREFVMERVVASAREMGISEREVGFNKDTPIETLEAFYRASLRNKMMKIKHRGQGDEKISVVDGQFNKTQAQAQGLHGVCFLPLL